MEEEGGWGGDSVGGGAASGRMAPPEPQRQLDPQLDGQRQWQRQWLHRHMVPELQRQRQPDRQHVLSARLPAPPGGAGPLAPSGRCPSRPLGPWATGVAWRAGPAAREAVGEWAEWGSGGACTVSGDSGQWVVSAVEWSGVECCGGRWQDGSTASGPVSHRRGPPAPAGPHPPPGHAAAGWGNAAADGWWSGGAVLHPHPLHPPSPLSRHFLRPILTSPPPTPQPTPWLPAGCAGCHGAGRDQGWGWVG